MAFLVCILLIISVSIIVVISNRRAKITAVSVNNESKTTIIENKTSSEETSEQEKVCLDPGHGGSDTGAAYGKITEAEINLEVAKKLQSKLEKMGYAVYLARTDDTFVAKRARARYCNSIQADILLSIHHNSYSQDRSVDYATALYYKDSDKALASSVLGSISDNLDIKNQGIAKFDNSELWIAEMPAALSEAFFITNTSEYSALINKSSTTLEKEAEALANGIENYFANPDQVENSVDVDSLYIDRAD